LSTTDPNLTSSIENLGWDDLVALRRRLSNRIKELSDKIIDIERNKIRTINNNIYKEKNDLNYILKRIKEIRSEIDSRNSQLFSISEKISQSKNFLTMMESRVSSEKEEDLVQYLNAQRKSLDEQQFRSARQKNEILSLIKETSMKIEAIKAIRIIKDQIRQLEAEFQNLSNSLRSLDDEQQSLRDKTLKINNIITGLFESKRQLPIEREMYLKEYNQDLLQLEKINGRLDYIANMRKKQRQEYGNVLPKDTLFKIKEEAKRKMECGSKLTLEELKLLFGD
jgi:uncharacterized coiled-coil DUF342 family protein